MSKIWNIYKNFEKAVEKSVQTRLSQEGGVTQTDIPPGILEKDAQDHAVIALKEIKSLIQTTPWELGIWGSKSKIKVDGVDKKIPSHMKQIYDKVVYAEKHPARALVVLNEIHQISRKALDDKPIVFSSFRERYKSTTQAYEIIEKQVSFKLN